MAFPGCRGFTDEPVCIKEDGCSLPLIRGYTTNSKFSSLYLGCKGACANPSSADETVGYGVPLLHTQSGMIFKPAVGFGFLMDVFFSFSLVYFSLHLR